MQARLADPFIDILSAPVTELFTVTLKPGHAMAELRPIMADLTSELKKGVAKGSHGSSWGPSVEKPEGVLIGIGGWDSTAASGSQLEPIPIQQRREWRGLIYIYLFVGSLGSHPSQELG